jgi:hypothetical protein
MCTPLCAMVVRDHLPNVESGGQTVTLAVPTAFRSHVAAQPDAAAVVKAIVVVPSLTCDDLYVLLQCSDILSTDTRHTVATSRCSGRC